MAAVVMTLRVAIKREQLGLVKALLTHKKLFAGQGLSQA